MKIYLKIIFTLSSAILLFLSFNDLGFLAWIALMPYLAVIYYSNLRQSIFYSFVCGLFFSFGLSYWVLDLPIFYVWMMIVIYLCIFFIIFGLISSIFVSKIRNHYIRIIFISSLWITIELLRSKTLLAFPIGTLGYTQYNFTPLMQAAGITGIYGISFIVLIFNLVMVESISYFHKNKKLNFKFLVIAISVFLLTVTYGFFILDFNKSIMLNKDNLKSINVALIQPNIKFGSKYSESGKEIIPDPYCSNRFFKENTELIIFPESILWGYMEENKPFYDWANYVLKKEKIFMLTGHYTFDKENNEYRNSALLYNPDLKIEDRYDEIHPVPFTQYVPYPLVFRYLDFLNYSNINLKPSEKYEPIFLPGKGYLGVNICYEITVPSIAGKIMANGAEALIIISDNSSLDNSVAPWHHLIFSKVRAIENNCYVIQCDSTGISAIISPDGSLLNKTELGRREVLYGTIYLIPQRTFYSKYGDLFTYIIFAAAFLWSAVYCFCNFKKSKNNQKTKDI